MVVTRRYSEMEAAWWESSKSRRMMDDVLAGTTESSRGKKERLRAFHSW
jgi:hypothetical protein